MHVKRQTVNQWENGERDIKTGDVIQLANYLAVSCDKLLRGIDAENLDVSSDLWLDDRAIKRLKQIAKPEMKDSPGGKNGAHCIK